MSQTIINRGYIHEFLFFFPAWADSYEGFTVVGAFMEAPLWSVLPEMLVLEYTETLLILRF